MDIALALIQHPHDNTILIAQRHAHVHLANFWEFPGGKALPDETLEDCARREAREEVGLEIEVLETWPSISVTYPDRTIVLHPFFCRAETGDAHSLDNQQIAWVLPQDLTNYNFPEVNQVLIARLQEES